MATTRKKKEESLSDITSSLENAKGVVFAGYRGMTVKEVDAMRKNLRKENVKYKVVKVTLLKKALAKLGIAVDLLKYSGPVAVATSQEEETVPARVLKQLGKTYQKLVIDGGIFNREVVGADVINQLASLPSREQLLGQLLSVMNGPAKGLVTVLSGNTRNLLNVLNAIADKKK